jgi:hypothetical protein
MLKFLWPNKNTFGLFVLANLVGLFCRTMSAGSPQCRVRQRIEGDRTALRAKIMDCTVIAERNVVRSDIMVPPLDSIHDVIQTYHWGYLHSCACYVYTRLIRLFYANLEVVQDDDCRLVLQSTVAGHTITVDPWIISHFIGVPVLQLSDSLYNEVVIPPSIDDLREFFYAVPQGEERATTITIDALSSHTACWARLFSTTYGHLLGAMTWFWRRPILFMPSIFAWLFAYASIFWALFWRPAMRAIPVYPSVVNLHRLFFSSVSISLESQRWRFKILLASKL